MGALLGQLLNPIGGMAQQAGTGLGNLIFGNGSQGAPPAPAPQQGPPSWQPLATPFGVFNYPEGGHPQANATTAYDPFNGWNAQTTNPANYPGAAPPVARDPSLGGTLGGPSSVAPRGHAALLNPTPVAQVPWHAPVVQGGFGTGGFARQSLTPTPPPGQSAMVPKWSR